MLQDESTKQEANSINNLVEQSTQKVTVEDSPKTNMKEEMTGAKTGVVIGGAADLPASAPNQVELLLKENQRSGKKSDTIDLKPDKTDLKVDQPFT